MREKVESVINTIKPNLQADGGNIELVDVEDGVVKVKLLGACAGCPMSQMTMTNYVEKLIKEKVPEIKRVENI